MAIYVGLLRAINVAGSGALAMSDLRALCEQAGFADVRTYIQSGNVVFTSALSAAKAKAALERRLAVHMGRPVGVQLRTAAEIADALARNPFKAAAPNQVVALFLDRPPPRDALADVALPGGEQLAVSGREIFAHYPDGIGASRLKLPFAATGTARNINTLARLAAMARPRGAG